SLYERYDVKQEHKIKCILHYFERTCSEMPMGNVSYERKVLPLQNSQSNIVYPEADFWSKSTVSLCRLEARTSGLIEDQPAEALEVDFANKSIGGGALRHGCVQEEIRCMINPELIVARLFLPSMADNEAIEIVGAERFSNYSGYAASFRFCGDHVDQRVSIQWEGVGRGLLQLMHLADLERDNTQLNASFVKLIRHFVAFLISIKVNNIKCNLRKMDSNGFWQLRLIKSVEWHQKGNWGCGAFWGDPEVKAIIQWLAASQALRPFMLYYTFNLEALQKLDLVVQWILSQGWTVGEVWNILVEYSTQRLKRQTKIGFFNWLLPSLYNVDPMILDVANAM
ncbi:UNVERIFIED_CONTAM: Poly(ADP-ribose) glycohydrolase 1, partial [Sesamum radiatum]